MNVDKISCAYSKCENVGTEEYGDGEFTFFLCKDCECKYEDSNHSGYCSLDCCLGYGCDGSC